MTSISAAATRSQATTGPPTTRSRSAVWRYYAVDAQAQTATCVFCKKALKYTPWEPSTSSLLKHLRFVHPDAAPEITNPTGLSSSSSARGTTLTGDADEFITVQEEDQREYRRVSSESPTMDPRRQIQQLLQDSILDLCKASLDAGQFEVDGIICISSPKDDQQIVVKMHEFIETATDGGLPGARNSCLQQTQRSNSISSNGGTNRMPSMFSAGSKPNPHSKHQFETLTQVLGSQGANTNDKEEVEDSGSKKKKVKIFEIIDEPLDSSPSEDNPWNSENLASDDNQLEVITVPDNNIPQEVALAVSKVMGTLPKRASPSPQGGHNIVKKAKVTVAHPNKNSPITGPGPYICNGCRRQFATRTSLSLHVVKKHSSYAMVYCGACQTGFVDRNTFSAHTCVKSHPSTDVVDPENDFIDQGGKLDVQSNNTLRSLLTAERMGARLRHADSVASRQPYVIDETDALLDEVVDSPASSTGKQAEDSPLNSTDEQDRNECTICSQVFDTFEDLEKHVWRRHKRYPCPHCFKTFTEKYTRERHYRIHTGVKPFRCGPCDRGFTRRDHLRTHCDTAHGYPTNLFDLNYKSGTFYPPGEEDTMETDSPAVLSADDIEITDSPVAQIVDEFIPLDGGDHEDSPLRFEPKTSDTHSGIPVFPMPTEIDHQAEWEEETSASVSHTEEHQQENISGDKESEQEKHAGVLKLEPTDPELDIL